MNKQAWLNELRSAMERGLTVEIDREKLTDDTIQGYIVAADDNLVVIHNLSDSITLDGYTVVRSEDITRFREADADIHEFYLRALELRKQQPEAPESLQLGSIESVLSSVHQGFDLVTVHTEKIDDEVCYIGQVVDVSGGELLLIELDAAAWWADEPDRYRLKDITRIDFGGQYEQALWLVSEYNRTHGVEPD